MWGECQVLIVVVKGCGFLIPIVDGGRDIFHHQDLAGNLWFNRVSVCINQGEVVGYLGLINK